MTMRQFLRDNRQAIDAAIKKMCPNGRPSNDAERRLWIANDEALYHWAKREGVRV